MKIKYTKVFQVYILLHDFLERHQKFLSGDLFVCRPSFAPVVEKSQQEKNVQRSSLQALDGRPEMSKNKFIKSLGK